VKKPIVTLGMIFGIIVLSYCGWITWCFSDYSDITFLLPAGYKGPFFVVQRGEKSVNLTRIGWHKYEVLLPDDGVLEVKDYSPFERWQTFYGHYVNDPVVSNRFLLKPLTGGMSSIGNQIDLKINYEWVCVGEEKEFQKALEVLSDPKNYLSAANIESYPRGVIKLPIR